MELSCVDEVVQVIAGTFRAALQDPVLRPRLLASRLHLRLGLVDPDCVLVIDAEHEEVRLARRGDVPPTLMAMSADTANRCCQGYLGISAAIAEGRVVVDGDLGDLISLMEDRDALPRLYAASLVRAGREDLLLAV